MLSYQHAYHAGSKADIHKHDILCHALGSLSKKATYIETHAGRGIYNLNNPESLKTGEAEEGWEKLIQHEKNLALLSPHYIAAVNKLNKGKLFPLYPGSPYLASCILNKLSALHLMELHPAENKALHKNMGEDRRISIHRMDGLEGALKFAKPDAPGLVLIDPSYEVKTEYEVIPEFAAHLHGYWKEASILVWVPMLPAMRHETLVNAIKIKISSVEISEVVWAQSGERRGMYGSIMMGINCAPAFQSKAASIIKNL